MSDIVLAVVGAVLLIYEIIALWNPMDDKKTISETLRKWNRESNSLVALLLGLLAGHLFW